MRGLQLVDWKHGPEFADVANPSPAPARCASASAAPGACHSDLHLMYDFEGGLLPWGPPFTLGHENAGWVDALGPGASGFQVGDAVAVYGPWGCGSCHRCVQGLENYCVHQAELDAAGGGLGTDGGMAEYMVVPDVRYLVPLGDLDPVEAAPLTDAALTPYHAIKRSLPLLVPGSTAVVIGSGGLGHMAVQILGALSPTRIVAVDREPNALAVARDVGAQETVLMGADAAEQIRRSTAGIGADVVLDFVGVDETLRLGAAVARSLGHLTLVGIGGGTLPLGFFTVPYELSVATTYWGSIPELFEVIALAQRRRDPATSGAVLTRRCPACLRADARRTAARSRGRRAVMSFSRIVVGTDGSVDAAFAVTRAADLAEAVHGELVVVSAVGLLANETSPGDHELLRAQLEHEWTASARRPGLAMRTMLRDGNPVSVLLAVADEVNADVIVVGSRGFGGFPELLLGSTSTQLAQHAQRAVLIVPRPGS